VTKNEERLMTTIVARNLKDIRIAKGYTQKELGKTVGVTFQQIQKYESAKDRITAAKLWRFSRVLGVSLKAFFEGIE